MSEDPDWVNLNPDESQNSNFYYNSSEKQFSLGPVYKREDLSLLLGSLKSKCNFLNFNYLAQMPGFSDIVPPPENEPLRDLGQYAEEDVFLNALQRKEKEGKKKGQNEQKNENNSLNVKRKNPLTASFFETFEKQGEIIEESEDDGSSESEASGDEELTFKDLKNLDLPKAYGFRLTDEEQLRNIDFSKISGHFSVLKAYLSEIFKEDVSVQYKKKENLEEVTCQIMINGEMLVEMDGKGEKRTLEKVSQLLLVFFSPRILKMYEEQKEKNVKSRKKVKKEGLEYRDFNLGKKNGEKASQNSEVNSNDSHDEVRNYKNLLPKKMDEEELRMRLDDILLKRTFSFGNFLSEMKTELLKTAAVKDKKALEKQTMSKCLNTMENLFKYYKLVKKKKKEDDILILSHVQESEFKVSIMERQENGEKKLISYGVHSFKSFALYFALSNFFETHLKGSYCSINKVYEEIRKMDGSYKEHFEEKKGEGGPLDMISQDLLNEIDNYSFNKKV